MSDILLHPEKANRPCPVSGKPCPEPDVIVPARLLWQLENPVKETDIWSLCLIGENQAGKLADFSNDLKRCVSSTGDGKQVVSGYSYWGIEPAIAWKQACQDEWYPVGRGGIRSFEPRWRDLQPKLDTQQYHYVSLGPGTGDKDRVVLNDLYSRYPDMFYLPVDMSAEMLRICAEPMRYLPFIRTFRSQILPIQLDFSVEENVIELNRLLRQLVGDDPVLYSLLGNTIANFEDDIELVERLNNQLLRPQDRLMLEVATTRQIDDATAHSAATEYQSSRAFRVFVTSSLHQNTDLQIDLGSVSFEGAVEGDRGVLVKAIYRNQSGTDLRILLPDRDEISFPQGDTVRLYLSRKYHQQALKFALKNVGFRIETEATVPARTPNRRGRVFGLVLMLLAKDEDPAYTDYGNRTEPGAQSTSRQKERWTR